MAPAPVPAELHLILYATQTRCFLSLSQASIQATICPPKPCALILAISQPCGTISKALAKSRKTASRLPPLSMISVIRSRNASRFVGYESYVVNPESDHAYPDA